MESGRSQGIKQLAELVAASDRKKKTTMTLTVTAGGSLILSITDAKDKPIIMDRSMNMQIEANPLDGIAQWAFYALAGKALGVDV